MNFALIGNPIEHSSSPALHNWVFRELGIDADYGKIKARNEDLQKITTSLKTGKLNGINVTLPHKQTIVPLLDELDHHAQAIGAVNCVAKTGNQLKGYNTDWLGFTKALEENGITIQGKDCLILGAGGVARAVAYAAIQSEPTSITIANRTRQKADSLASWINTVNSKIKTNSITLEEADTVTKVQIVINCTSLGMSPHSYTSPFTSHDLGQYHLLVDTVYSPPVTRFLSDGRSSGARTMGGLDMFIYQGLASLDLWFAKPISQQINVRSISKYLKEKLMETSLS